MLGRAAADDPAAERLNRTELAQPAVFVIDYAMAKLWMSWGIVPEAVIGHSLGEYAAACIAGMLSLEDALALVADRARMIQALPGGAMLAVSMDESALRPFLSPDAVDRHGQRAGADGRLGTEGCGRGGCGAAAGGCRPHRAPPADDARLPLAHDGAGGGGAGGARGAGASCARRRIPMISNVTGTWISDAEATDPGYWTRHLLGTVRFADGVARAAARARPRAAGGRPRADAVHVRPPAAGRRRASRRRWPSMPSLRYAYDRKPDAQFLAEALGRLWVAGVEPDWRAYRAGERRRRVQLPTYPWEKQRYWVDPPALPRSPPQPPRRWTDTRRPDPADWTYLPDVDAHRVRRHRRRARRTCSSSARRGRWRTGWRPRSEAGGTCPLLRSGGGFGGWGS